MNPSKSFRGVLSSAPFMLCEVLSQASPDRCEGLYSSLLNYSISITSDMTF